MVELLAAAHIFFGTNETIPFEFKLALGRCCCCNTQNESQRPVYVMAFFAPKIDYTTILLVAILLWTLQINPKAFVLLKWIMLSLERSKLRT